MSKIKAVRYTDEKKEEWNRFNRESKNPLFLFDRDYMDYHSDRFTDHSLMFYDEDRLVALLPMSIEDKALISHAGLTYGGFITDVKMKQHIMNDCVDALLSYARGADIKRILYKSIPHFHHLMPAEEDEFSLFQNQCNLKYMEAATVIDLRRRPGLKKSRKSQINRAKKEGVLVKERTSPEDYTAFMKIENDVLQSRHHTTAVHTEKEIFSLHQKFPENIHLFSAELAGEMIAGAIVFEYERVVHTQYLAANETARRIGGLDLVIDYIIHKYEEEKDYLDFGKSTEDHGRVLNEGLISQKEGFGGRTEILKTWSIDIGATNRFRHGAIDLNVSFVPYDDVFFEKSASWLSDPEIKYLTMTPDLDDKTRKEWFEGLSLREDYYIEGIMLDDEPIGAVGLKHIDLNNRTGEYWGYIGEKEYFGKGIGHIMVEHMIRYAKSIGIQLVSLRVRNDNERAKRLYQKRGFKRIDEINDVLIMVWQV